MRSNLLAIFVLCSIVSVAQTTTKWTKESRNTIYNEILDDLQPYKNITKDQKESIAICYLGEITKKYTQDDYRSMIDIELKRVKSTYLTECSKNLGIALDLPKIEEPQNGPQYTKKSFLGVWRSKDIALILDANANVTKGTGKNYKKEENGTWFLVGDKLRFEFKKYTETFKITYFDKETITLAEEGGIARTIYLTKIEQ